MEDPGGAASAQRNLRVEWSAGGRFRRPSTLSGIRSTDSLDRLNARVLRRRKAARTKLLEAGARALDLDMESLKRDHENTNQLLRKALSSNRKALLAAPRGGRRRVRRFRRTTNRLMKRHSGTARHGSYTTSMGTAEKIFACLWDADSMVRFGGGFTINEVSSGIGENTMRHLVSLNDAQSLSGAQAGAGLVFQYEPDEDGALEVTVDVEIDGVVELFAGSSCFGSHRAQAEIRIITSVVQEQFGQSMWIGQDVRELVSESVSDGNVFADRITESVSVPVVSLVHWRF